MLAQLASQTDAMLELLRRWVEIETPSAEPARVRRLAAEVAEAFAAAGCRSTMHEWGLELAAGPPGDPRFLLLGHLDTVYPAGTLASSPFRREGDRAYGPGGFDMKGGVVEALFALRALGPQVPSLKMLLVFDEEIGSPHSRPLTESLARTAAAVLVLEPAEKGNFKIARKGIARYTLVARGVPAHAGVDFEQGASAISALAARIAEAAAWSEPRGANGLTVNPGVFHGGTVGNVVAAEAHAELDVRAWSAAVLEATDRRLRALAPPDPRVRFEWAGGINRPPMEPTPASLELLATAQRLGRELGLELEAVRTGGGSDGNFTAALGVPTLDGMGMAGAGAHTPGEHILVSQLAPRTALLARLLASAS